MPNLDGMFADDLMSFWSRHQRGRGAKELFPDRPKFYVRTTDSLANYAANKATAMQCRIRGDITGALMYEDICDRIYKTLPDYAQW